jgi:hypothetical protein
MVSRDRDGANDIRFPNAEVNTDEPRAALYDPQVGHFCSLLKYEVVLCHRFKTRFNLTTQIHHSPPWKKVEMRSVNKAPRSPMIADDMQDYPAAAVIDP